MKITQITRHLSLCGIALLAAILTNGCSESRKTDTAAVELEGNPTTGYTWVYTISSDNIISETSNEYIPSRTEDNVVGSGGKFVFTFEGITEGETEIVFSYLRVWEEDIPPARTVIYRAVVDSNKKLTLSEK